MLTDLFVYGTLRSGFGGPHAKRLAEQATCLGEAKVRGSLYRITYYPGAVSEGRGWIHGEVWRMREPDKTLAALDDYEGYPYEFDRATTIAQLKSGAELPVWIYWYALDVQGKPNIPGGDFLAQSPL
jgi:gamma-glutamylcyclotransferase (GGCT)/AIG2-like uncharacterized protein YtfP